MLLPISHERLEYSSSDQFRNAWAIIGDGNVQLRSSTTNMDRDRSFIPKSLLCILDDIRKTTSQAHLIQRQLAGLINPDNESYLLFRIWLSTSSSNSSSIRLTEVERGRKFTFPRANPRSSSLISTIRNADA